MWDAARDLLLGACCAGCGRPGRALCRHCAARLPHTGAPAWPTPTPRGLVLPMAAGDYDDLLKELVLAHKERHALALAGPLGDVLAGVVADLLRTVAPGRDAVLVPVPSRRAVVRARGHDPMLRVARRAAATLRRGGTVAAVRPLLASAHAVRDQAGLGAEARAANLAGSLRCRTAGPRLLPAEGAASFVVDDVLTTGSTAREAQRALEEGGVTVLGIATVAATRRRFVR